MSRWPLWAVLAPGEPAQLESRALAIAMPDWEEEDGDEPPFEVIPGSGRYHAIVGVDPIDIGAEMQIAKALSLECDEPVYSIERANDPWTVMSWRSGAPDVLEVSPDGLAKSLGSPLPGGGKPLNHAAATPLRHVALVEGVRAYEAHRALEDDYGRPLPPGRYHLEDTPRGLRVSSGTGDIGFADVNLSERLPNATVYGVMASPGLDVFVVNRLEGGECIGQFAQPPREDSFMPVVSDIKGESSPERILAALGIPAEWFR
ncbi:hypothetical protein [Archangium violaceum]|uniref:Uncharacterized protein n=1 Tax=Archangium violaceum Cb vi76 TaxID=1406225 RepID=A0A084SIW3_9BACT|nr:hypothetical protein [Archangium violaceum]KFA88398.1 hypothetical protein Q664_40920 [Archangium violaceum Cb vi76]